MMGERRVMQEARFYGLSLERHAPDTWSAALRFERADGLAISPVSVNRRLGGQPDCFSRRAASNTAERR